MAHTSRAPIRLWRTTAQARTRPGVLRARPGILLSPDPGGACATSPNVVHYRPTRTGEALSFHRTMMARLPIAVSIILVPVLTLCLLTWTEATAQGVLLLHDAGPSPSPAEEQAIAWTCDLLGHFGADVSVVPVDRYAPGAVGKHDATVFLGLRPGAHLPEPLLADCEQAEQPICWIGANIEQLMARAPENRYGFVTRPDVSLAGGSKVFYKDASYRREAAELPAVTITKSDLCQPVAMVEVSGERRPYATRSGRLWYFPEVPLAAARGASVHLVLCDQMHEIMEDRHDVHRTALLYVTGVTPETDPGRLDALLRTLQAQGVPFGIEVAPTVRASRSRRSAQLAEKRRLVSVLRGAQRAGASIIALLPETDARTGTVSHRGNDALRELARCGLYAVALSVERRKYVGEQAAELGNLCSTLLDRGEENARGATAQMPFVIAANQHGQRVMPGNLPLLAQGRGEVEAMLEAARRQTVVPDPWVTAGIAVGAPAAAVSLLVGGLQDSEFACYDLRFADNSIRGESLLVRTVSNQYKVGELLPKGWSATVLGPEAGASLDLGRPDKKRLSETMVRPGAILVGYPAGKRPEVVFSFEGDAEQVTQRAVQRLAQVIVMVALAAAGVLFCIYLLQLVQRRGR